MPELVACPVCGCRVQMADAMLGRQVRCVGCNGVYTATADAAPERAVAFRRVPNRGRAAPSPERRAGRCVRLAIGRWTGPTALPLLRPLEFESEVPPDLTPGRQGWAAAHRIATIAAR